MMTVKNVSYAYQKNQPILQNISFVLQKGVTLLIGENGSGKTTLIKVMTAILPSSGDISIGDIGVGVSEYKQLIAYLPQEFDIYPTLKVRDILRFAASLKKVAPENIESEVNKVVQQTNISGFIGKPFKKCSAGMKRRVGIATALIGNPQIIILDEPTAGVDPKERILFYKTIKECFAGKSVLISTHIMDDIEILADNVIMLSKGRVTYSGEYDSWIHSLDDKISSPTTEDLWLHYQDVSSYVE